MNPKGQPEIPAPRDSPGTSGKGLGKPGYKEQRSVAVLELVFEDLSES